VPPEAWLMWLPFLSELTTAYGAVSPAGTGNKPNHPYGLYEI
jgi:hypothetical protein